jgi:hypothetical protein
MHSGEEAHLHYLTLARIERSELVEGAVQCDHIETLLHADSERLLEGRANCAAASLVGAMPSRVIHKDAPHHAHGDSEKVRAVSHLWLFLAAKPQVYFVDQGRGLEGVPIAFTPQMMVCQPLQFVVYDAHKLFQRLRVPTAPPAK